MRIISRFKDYYDGVHGPYSFGNEPLYVREQKDVEYKDVDKYPLYRGNTITSECGIETTNYTIGFCGKFYHCVHFTGRYLQDPGVHCYNIGQVHKYVASLNEKQRGEFKEKTYKFRFNRKKPSSKIDNIEKYFELASIADKGKTHLFDEFNCPVFVGYVKPYSFYRTITFNDQLKRFNFARIVRPEIAYQEIQMWLSNRAIENKPIPAISNEDMIEAKGFNKKSSFRKAKSK